MLRNGLVLWFLFHMSSVLLLMSMVLLVKFISGNIMISYGSVGV